MFDYILSPAGRLILVLLPLPALAGVWLAVTGILPYPPRSHRRTVGSFDRNRRERTGGAGALDSFCRNASKRLAPYMRMTELEETELQKALSLSGEEFTPREYRAYCLTAALLFWLTGAFFLLAGALLKLKTLYVLAAGLAALGAVTFFLTGRALRKKVRQAVSGIEAELPRFVSYLVLALRSEDRGVPAAVERYTAGNGRFAAELDRAVADAKTSDFESAMNRWDQRVNSDRLKLVLHGLVAANNGDDVSVYFAMLEKDFSAYEVTLLKQNIKTIPEKMRFPKTCMFISIFATMFVPILLQVADSFMAIFGSGAL